MAVDDIAAPLGKGSHCTVTFFDVWIQIENISLGEDVVDFVFIL